MIGGGIDYESGPYNVTIPAKATTVQFDVAINDDNILEGNENFNLSIMASSQPSRIDIDNPARATITIVDDDGKHLI